MKSDVGIVNSGELKNSLETASQCLADCETVDSFKTKNEYDIYVGVDVFGRNTFGGGEFRCNAAVSGMKIHPWLIRCQ